ncbi:MAG: hypothetical protein J6P56_02645 [Bacteroidales bacterium]|nr:hypothetical protein [Bacteroidales bacterium]
MKKIIALMAIMTAMMMVSCKPQNDDIDDEEEGQEQEETQKLKINIDGTFADWAALDPSLYVKALNDPNSPWPGVAEIRCCAEGDFVYYYIRFDQAALQDAFAAATPSMHIRLCINVDNEFSSGYQSYFRQGYDFIVEGAIAEGGQFVAYDGTLHQRIDGAWKAILDPGHSLVSGAGSGNEYEIALIREIFNGAAGASTVPMQMGDVFQTGIRFYYDGWEEFSNMPNADQDSDGTGWGDLLQIEFLK